MIVSNILRWLCGTVTFEITGGYLERFLNLVNREKIPIWSIERRENAISAQVRCKHYREIRPCVRKAGVHAKIVRKHGLPFITNKYKKRKGLLTGLLLAICFLFVMSNFVWQVEVKGNETIDTQKILDVFEEYGVKSGTPIFKLDAGKIQQRAMLDLPEVSWIALNLHGTKAVIEIKERIKPPDQVPDDVPCNLIATKDGQIKRIEAYSGQKAVKINQAVKKGDLLVSGIITDHIGKTMLSHAQGKVIARTHNQYEFRIAQSQTVKEYSGKEIKRSYLEMFGVKVPLFLAFPIKGEYEKTLEKGQLEIFGLSLPVEMYHFTFKQFDENEKNYTEKELKEQAMKQLEEKKQSELSGATILSETVDGQLINGEYILKATIECEEDIAISQEIFTK